MKKIGEQSRSRVVVCLTCRTSHNIYLTTAAVTSAAAAALKRRNLKSIRERWAILGSMARGEAHFTTRGPWLDAACSICGNGHRAFVSPRDARMPLVCSSAALPLTLLRFSKRLKNELLAEQGGLGMRNLLAAFVLVSLSTLPANAQAWRNCVQGSIGPGGLAD